MGEEEEGDRRAKADNWDQESPWAKAQTTPDLIGWPEAINPLLIPRSNSPQFWPENGQFRGPQRDFTNEIGIRP